MLRFGSIILDYWRKSNKTGQKVLRQAIFLPSRTHWHAALWSAAYGLRNYGVCGGGETPLPVVLGCTSDIISSPFLVRKWDKAMVERGF